MKRITIYLPYLLISISIIAVGFLSGCVDRTFSDFDEEIGEGVSTLRLTATIDKMTPALDSRTNGNAVHDVNSLWIVMYRHENGKWELYKRVDAKTCEGYQGNQTGNTSEPTYPAGPQGGNFGETQDKGTFKASFKIPNLPYGKYHIYAVANIEPTPEQCATEESLKSIQATWKNDVSQDNWMFGYFTNADEQGIAGFGPYEIVVKRRMVDLHAWMKRMVSKVTVAFDPSGLEEAVTVYIKKVSIRDIPKTCWLGKYNKPDKSSELESIGESVDYSNGSSDYSKWAIKLQKGSGIKGSSHANGSDDSLFFFENMQDDYQDDKDYLKEQIPDETGTPIDEAGTNEDGKKNDFKDRIDYGTWVEVEAYYVSKNTKKMSSGPITYRFMLGKNTTYNYDAERNYHYKLTLKLRGYANDADWHISYDEPAPTVYTPDKYYISYLYGQKLEFPVRILTGDPENTSKYILKAEIIENPWWPWDEENNTYPNQEIGDATNPNGFAWYRTSVVGENATYNGKKYAGFLALRQPEMKNGKYEDIDCGFIQGEAHDYGKVYNDYLESYYVNHNVGDAAYKLSVEGDHYVGLYNENTNKFDEGSAAAGTYTVTSDSKDNSVTIKVPMYTRPKKMIIAADFTGNNPYSSYMRQAKVKFTLWNEKGEQVDLRDPTNKNITVKERIVPIQQVRRIENPKAIYRAYDNDAEFEIKLMHLINASPTAPPNKFEPFTSDGPWRASIMSCTEDFVKLYTDGGQEVTSKGQYITGLSGTEIIFKYKPKGILADPHATRCAIILVEYHDYTCNHLIFVRQGYDAGVELAGTKWSLYQVYATGKYSTSTSPENLTDVNVVVTKSPLSVGSFLKRCQYNYSIIEKGNPGWLELVNNALNIAYIQNGKAKIDSKKWSDIQGFGWYRYDGSQKRYDNQWADTWTTVDYQAGQQLTVPTWEQFKALKEQCDFGFGIAYADGATTTAESLSIAYGYSDEDNTGVRNECGMRVCVAYDHTDGKNVIFPLGKYGQARRARLVWDWATRFGKHLVQNPTGTKSYSGPISYGGVACVLSAAVDVYRPLTYNHYRSPGAVYWVKQPNIQDGRWGNGTPAYASWDINYFTLTFNNYDPGSIAGWDNDNGKQSTTTITNTNVSDALPIKLVYKK